MLQYTIKRLLLAIPTFFLISLVIFVVLNVAPGRPGAVMSQAGEQAGDQNESYRIFKEQFNLDKPILINTRGFSLTTEGIRELVATAEQLEGDQSAADRVWAKNALEDYGNTMVRHLMVLLEDPDPEMSRLAAIYLSASARRRLLRVGDRDFLRVENGRLEKDNQTIRTWTWEEAAPVEEVASIKENWTSWYAENQDFYEYTTSESIYMMFFETRFSWYWYNLSRLDLGVSSVDRRPVLQTILSKLKYSLSLTTIALVLAYIIAVPLGLFSAVRQGTTADTLLTIVLFMMYSLPTFFTGTVLLRLFSEGDPLAWFPSGGFSGLDTSGMTTIEYIKDVVWHLGLPIATYISGALVALSRYARTGVIDVIRSDYVRTARAKGLSEPVVIIKHAARNGMIPILTLLGGLLPALVGGSVVIEVIFNIPGMGQYLFSAINLRDYNAVMGVLLTSSLLAQAGILLSDLSYALVDPRVSFD
jgi:peptide/nickel transport system permease protein